MREHAAETIVGAIVLAAAAVFLWFALSNSGGQTSSGYELRAGFDQVDGLDVGADVRVAGVPVGQVRTIALDPQTFRATVTFSVKDGLEMPADSSVALKTDGLLGGLYVALEPGLDAEMLKPGEEVTYSQGALDILRLLADVVQNLGD